MKKLMIYVSVMACVLGLVGCAKDEYKSETNNTNSTQENITAKEEYQTNQFNSDYFLELKSVISEHSTVYVTFILTAPENVDFSDVLDIRTDANLGFPGLLAQPSGSNYPANIFYEILDDKDGKNNTLKVVLRINPVIEQGSDSAFGPGKTCEIVFKDIVKWGHNWEYEQELLATKYAGQRDYMLTDEESEKVHPRTLLASGEWKFVIELTETDSGNIKLLDSPVSTEVLVVRTGATEFETIHSVEPVTLTSISIDPVGVEITFDIPEPSDQFSCIFIDGAMISRIPGNEPTEYENVAVVMKDGTEISLFQSMGAKKTAILSADSPIVLEEVDYLQMSDGTKIYAK